MSLVGKIICAPMVVALLTCVRSVAGAAPGGGYDSEEGLSLQKLIEAGVPKNISEGLYVSAWAWGSYLNASRATQRSNGDGQLSLDVTKSFGGRVAVTTEWSLFAADDHWRGELEQAFVSVLISEQAQTVVTLGKFHADIGAEPRDFWDRLTGTTSLLFSAEPQDLVGIMLTQPLGETHVTLKPFVATGFEGLTDIRNAPAGGLMVQYRPKPELTLTLTNWVGPGYGESDWGNEEGAGSGGGGYGSGYGGYGAGGGTYGGAYGGLSAIENWLGPNLVSERGGVIYFVDGNVVWKPREDLTLAGEALSGTTRGAESATGWQGLLALASVDLTDQWRVFGRWSFLNDSSGIITGAAQRRHELSAGLACQMTHNLELRGEYRHDFSNPQGDSDTVSVHFSLGY